MIDRDASGDAESVDKLIQRACAEFSEVVVIESGTERITYTALLVRAEELASRLRGSGLKRGGIVAIVGCRSAAVIVAVLAVWLAGGIVLLIDETLPETRRELMLDSAAASFVVQCGATSRIRTRAGGVGAAAAWSSNADHAYVAFTSGSTGAPKAIVGSHRGLAHFLKWQVEEFAIGVEDRFAHLTNISFDVWFRDALSPLLGGATLCIPIETHLGADNVLDFIRGNAISGLHVVPSIAEMWLAEADDVQQIVGLGRAFFAGEPLDGSLVSRWNDVFPNCQVVNLYGPSETTLAQYHLRVPSAPAPGIQSVGHAIPGSRSFVLDENQAECPPGVVGEVYINAAWPSHGYLVKGRIVSPFVRIEIGDDSHRCYPTGDLGRVLPDGALEISGRRDDQVKIGGVRIELQEVRSVVRSAPRVRDAFICAVPGLTGKILAGVVQMDDPDESVLRNHLRSHLMGVMIPAMIVFVPELPMLSNGKLDRRRLGDMVSDRLAEQARSATARKTSESRRTVSERLEDIWAELVGTDALTGGNAPSTFFESGGTSLTIVGLHAKIQREFGIQFPLVRLFEKVTLHAQCHLIEQLMGRGEATDAGRDTAAPRAPGRRQLVAARQARRIQLTEEVKNEGLDHGKHG
ncbi:non-ribosomal peptide synthetase [Rathayibacter rathayi]|uniref:non-ribosomal peptide synthetase n=1 Tax=Rathayibacter rathayi TaxID=33887 RepID=UPI000CE91E62|nr:non-ribosomal peptide synthetase [Rathayibacter rathayi]PPF23416.1 hypothetical protein C5C34_08920 [Rathayibacter rathayi]PPG97105.1 hypothetical protein C5C22_01520 [Rathayibacter rathayi]PPI75117.1 hypothetical protein C5E12_01725 [Rathayibacter rathayi]